MICAFDKAWRAGHAVTFPVTNELALAGACWRWNADLSRTYADGRWLSLASGGSGARGRAFESRRAHSGTLSPTVIYARVGLYLVRAWTVTVTQVVTLPKWRVAGGDVADAFSAYYITHKRGAALNRKRVAQFLRVFFDIGDCAFDNPGHHGTPNQRMDAARLGFSIAAEARSRVTS
jgi:hypothetical protein